MRFALAAALLAVAVASATAHSYRHGSIAIGHAWGLPSQGGETRVMVPLLESGQPGDALVGASSPLAARVEIRPEADAAPVPRLELVPRRPFGMRPNGPHLRMVGLSRPLAAGDRVPMTLTFARAGPIEIEVWIEPTPYASRPR